MFGGARTCVFCAVAFLVAGAEGQSYQAFQWKFGNNFIEQAFEECQTLPIVVESITNDSSALGVPPYYLIAFEVSGVPTTTMVGSDPTNLTWTANHKQGSTLMLSLMDSNKSTGGIPPNLFSMNAGSDMSCLPSLPTQPAIIHPNVSDLSTCQPWGLTISGGTKPYQVVLSALDSPVITNVTMGDNDDVFTFIDRANPNGQLMASVVDASGQWGISTSITNTTGSTDVSCVGLVSSSQTSAQIAQEAADRAHAAQEADTQRRTRLVAGLVVGLGVPILLGAFMAVWLWRRQREPGSEEGTWDNQDTTPRPLSLPASGDMREAETAPLSSKSSAFASYSAPGTPRMEVTPIPPIYFDREITEAQQQERSAGTAASTSGSGSGSGSDSSPMSVAEASARYRKALQASRGQLYTTSSPSATPSAQVSVQSLHGLPANPRPVRPSALNSQLIDVSLDPDVQPDIIIQHRDGGVVQELPPPYAARSAERGPPPPISPSEASPSPADTP